MSEEQLNKVVLSADFRPPRSKRVARPARSCLYTLSEVHHLTPSEVYHLTPSETAPLPRVRQYLCPERDSTSALSGTAPLSRARQLLRPERDSTSAPNGTVPLPRVRQHLCPERGGTSDLWRQGGQEGWRTADVYIVLFKVCFCKDCCRSL